MSSEDERVAWLRATIEGDRALAKRVAARYVAGPGSSREGEAIWPTTVIERAWQEYEDPDVRAGLDFIRAHDPQDVIADCESKLVMLDWAGKIFSEHGWREPDLHSWDSELAAINGARFVRRQIASAYRNRDGYAEHWEKPAQA